MENHFYHIKLPPLTVTFLLGTCVTCVMGAGIVREVHRTQTATRQQEENYSIIFKDFSKFLLQFSNAASYDKIPIYTLKYNFTNARLR